VCGKIQGRFVNRGERLIKFRDSWFSMKSIEVEYFILIFRSRALDWRALSKDIVILTKLQTLKKILIKVIRQWAIRFIVKRETAQKKS